MDLQAPRLLINRELSWLAFNERVLAEAMDATLPLYERIKFITIVSGNLDEFFMVRVAGLKQQIAAGVTELSADGLSPAEQFAAVSERAHALVAAQDAVWRELLVPALDSAGVNLIPHDALNADQRAAARAYFFDHVFPVLTPLAIDPGHPFPNLRNKSLNLVLLLRREGRARRRMPRETLLAVVQVPSVIPRLVPVAVPSGNSFLLLDNLIAAHASELFGGFIVSQATAFRLSRNLDLTIDEEESEDLLSTIQEELRRRDRGAAVRLELGDSASMDLERALCSALKLEPVDVYRLQGPLQLSDMITLADFDSRAELKADPFTPVVPQKLRDSESIFNVIREQDFLLHHPYESFDPVVRLIEEAADDPSVLAIKQTLYRTSGDSPLVRALSRAADNGKQVAVLVEIKARFDEASNIAWARRLEESGVHVVYGLIGLKTHCKVVLVVRRERGGIRRYVHLGTGNYNPQTARVYTDLSFFSARRELADDASELFNLLTGYSVVPNWRRLAVAPMNLQQRILELIDREAQRAGRGEPARIAAKMNALVDPTVIRALYAASCAGVDIELFVRGICCLRPGVPEVSERIRVTSIVDRYLEHSRVFAFGAGAETEVYLSSADWMPRNFQRRVEVMFPVEEPGIRKRILEEVLGLAASDNTKARQLQADGSYVRTASDGPPVRSQIALMELAKASGETRGPLLPRLYATT
jgi:polyphosphate kinase